MAFGASNKARMANRPKPEPTKLDKLKEALRKQYVIPTTAEPSPAPAPSPEKKDGLGAT